MFKRFLLSGSVFFWINACRVATNQSGAESLKHTLLVYHDECTECGDFEIDSGEVQVPVFMRPAFIQAKMNSGVTRKWPRRRIVKMLEARDYQVGSVALVSEAAFDSLFLLPGHHRDDTLKNKYGIVYPWDFDRRYRVTGEIIGIKAHYLQFKIHTATRITDRNAQR
ncbi:hypothetical protein [Hymenobacter ruricola]|uniref:Uncharacterized protein n=1 Tax=Hymenobacter ruricola TaxID=2791023 RepID=A0ABS0I279_9BACT|nr:hypothetical protein [Hymenobacter ruricola]MBF9221015.1 hypothetical protein [Hymenobacter ruricola]